MENNLPIRFYFCKRCGKGEQIVLGIITGERRAKLSTLRISRPVDEVTPELLSDRKNFAMIDVDQGTAICGMCGSSRTWRLSEKALKDFMSRHQARKFGLE